MSDVLEYLEYACSSALSKFEITLIALAVNSLLIMVAEANIERRLLYCGVTQILKESEESCVGMSYVIFIS